MDKDGKPFKVALVTGSMAAFTKPVAELLQAQLKDVGVAVEIKAVENGVPSQMRWTSETSTW